MFIELGKKPHNAAALTAANTNAADFEEAVMTVYNWRCIPQHELRGTLSTFLDNHLTNFIPPPIVMTSRQNNGIEKTGKHGAEGEIFTPA